MQTTARSEWLDDIICFRINPIRGNLSSSLGRQQTTRNRFYFAKEIHRCDFTQTTVKIWTSTLYYWYSFAKSVTLANQRHWCRQQNESRDIDLSTSVWIALKLTRTHRRQIHWCNRWLIWMRSSRSMYGHGRRQVHHQHHPNNPLHQSKITTITDIGTTFHLPTSPKTIIIHRNISSVSLHLQWRTYILMHPKWQVSDVYARSDQMVIRPLDVPLYIAVNHRPPIWGFGESWSNINHLIRQPPHEFLYQIYWHYCPSHTIWPKFEGELVNPPG